MRETIVETAFRVLDFLQPAYGIAFALLFFVFIPLGLFDKTRRFSSDALWYSSYLFGAVAWLSGVGVTFGLLGWFWLFVGLVLFALGVVPLGIIAALLDGHFGLALGVAFPAILAIGARLVSTYLAEKAGVKQF